MFVINAISFSFSSSSFIFIRLENNFSTKTLFPNIYSFLTFFFNPFFPNQSNSDQILFLSFSLWISASCNGLFNHEEVHQQENLHIYHQEKRIHLSSVYLFVVDLILLVIKIFFFLSDFHCFPSFSNKSFLLLFFSFAVNGFFFSMCVFRFLLCV